MKNILLTAAAPIAAHVCIAHADEITLIRALSPMIPLK
jgi:hypothetical protein